MNTDRTLVVVVTGVSGAGKSTAVNALEDLGFFCVDNLPPPLIEPTLAAFAAGGVRRVALGIDVRVRSFLGEAAEVVERVGKDSRRELSVLFLDASDQALLRRFSSTRRPHPLGTPTEPGGQHAAIAVLDGLRIERELLSSLRASATVIVDTTRLSVHELRRRIVDRFGPGSGKQHRMHTRFVSFGFKYGTPVDADLVFDVRFLKNPYFVPELSDLPGTTEEVRGYVLTDPATHELMEHVENLLSFCLPRFEQEGRAYLTVAIGCTGGRHRSVVVAELLAKRLAPKLEISIDLSHRDLERVAFERAGELSEPESGVLGG